MQTTRRSFIAGASLTGGLGALPLSALGAAATAPMAEPDFGPKIGQALLSRNENPYGPAPSALRAIADTAKMGCYYADRGLQRLTAMIAERHGVAPAQVVVGAGSTEILCAIALAWGRKGAILCPDLFWDTTVIYGERQGITSIRVPLTADMNVDLPAMAAKATDAVSLIQLDNISTLNVSQDNNNAAQTDCVGNLQTSAFTEQFRLKDADLQCRVIAAGAAEPPITVRLK